MLGCRLFQSTFPIWGTTFPLTRVTDDALVSIHAPHTGSDLAFDVSLYQSYKFQSTLPVWGATRSSSSPCLRRSGFSPRPPHVGSNEEAARPRRRVHVSTHAPHVGSDCAFHLLYYRDTVSTHAPHVGSDSRCWDIRQQAPRFNPRSPCGERLSRHLLPPGYPCFNPRSPCGERRGRASLESLSSSFQSTLPIQ